MSANTVTSGRAIILTFDENLDASSRPLTGNFIVKADGVSVGIVEGEAGVSRSFVYFGLSDTVFAGQTVTVSYTDPTTGDDGAVVQDLAGNDAPSFTDAAVRNDSKATPPPVVTIETLTPTVSYNVGTGERWDIAEFRLTRTGTTDGKLRVKLAWKELASELGFAGEPVAFVYFRPGQSVKTVKHLVIDSDGNGDPLGSITYEVYAGDGYVVGEPASAVASVTVPNRHMTRSESVPAEIKALPSVEAPPALDVSDAQAREGPDGTIAFAVTLERPASATVAVDWATADGSARAGEDYVAANGTLSFAPGETSKSVVVTLLDDAIDEDSETFTLTLSNARGAQIRDGRAEGTIENADPLPQAWLARFGRTIAGHAADAIGDRLADAEARGSQVTLAGRRLPLGAHAAGAAFAGQPLGAGGTARDGSLAGFRTVAGRDLLPGSSFRLALGGDGDAAHAAGTRWTAWGRAASSRFGGGADGIALDGEATTVTLGADAAWDGLLAGVALSLGSGGGSFRAHPGSGQGDGSAGALGGSLTSVHPYLRYQAGESLSLWGMLGYGTGEVELGGGRAAPATVDTTMRMAAAGARSLLTDAGESGGPQLALRADALLTQVASDGAAVGDGPAASEAETGRLRLVLEGSDEFALDGGQTLTPTLELGLRHDSGDAETGTGIEAGGGLRFVDPGTGLVVDAEAHGLIAHDDADYAEWGASASLRYGPDASGRGVSLTLAPAWGTAASGADRLWSLDHAGAPGAGAGNPGARFHAEAGYGVPAFRARGLATPYAGLSLGESGERTLRSGVRWTLGQDLAFAVEGTRRTFAHESAPDHGIGLRASMRW